MKVRCDYCGAWFDPAEDVLACYCPHCDRWSCADCYIAASLAWFERRRAIGEFPTALRKVQQRGERLNGITAPGCVRTNDLGLGLIEILPKSDCCLGLGE